MMDATMSAQPATQDADQEGKGIAFVRRVREVTAAIERLDHCAGHLRAARDKLDESLYGELATQAFCYAAILTEWKQFGIGLADPRVCDLSEEIDLFCTFLEEDFGT